MNKSVEKDSSSLYQQLYNCILGALIPFGISRDGEHVYKIEWEYMKRPEVYYFRRKDISNMVQDILYEHPRRWNYRMAINALCIQEQFLTKWKCNSITYWNIRNKMVDLSNADCSSVFDSLATLGPNPTLGLDPDVKTSKKLASILINKIWYSGTISEPSIVRRNMIKDLLENPAKAMQTNTYVYSALKEHSIWK